MDIFTEIETLVGFIDTDSGGIVITDMLWDVPANGQKRFSVDLELEKTRIPIKAIRTEGGKRRLILEIDEGINLLSSVQQETVEVVDLPDKEEK